MPHPQTLTSPVAKAMQLNGIDWIIIGSFLLASLLVGLYVSHRSGSNTESFFLSGRNMPWWLLGTSIVF